MYIPPGFTLIACEAVSEEELRLWTVESGAVWHPALDIRYTRRCTYAGWPFGVRRSVQAHVDTLTDEDVAEWTPLMHKPPQGVINVEFSESLAGEAELCSGLLQALFTRWDGYAYDIGAYEWVSDLLNSLLPPERILRFERPLPDQNFGRFYTFSHRPA